MLSRAASTGWRTNAATASTAAASAKDLPIVLVTAAKGHAGEQHPKDDPDWSEARAPTPRAAATPQRSGPRRGIRSASEAATRPA